MAGLNKRASCSFISILSLRRREQEWQNFRRVEYWEIIADNLHDASGVWAGSQRLIPKGEQSGLLTRIATTESVSLCVRITS